MATDYTQTVRRSPAIEAAQENYIDLLTQQVGRAPGSLGVPTLAELGPQTAGQNVLTQAAQQQAATQAGLGQLGQQLGGEDINRLLGLGQLTQQFGFEGPEGAFVPGQAQIEAARATTLAEQKEPFERTAFASDILRGVPSSQITYTQQPTPSALQQALGLGIAGLGAYGAAGGTFGGVSSLGFGG